MGNKFIQPLKLRLSSCMMFFIILLIFLTTLSSASSAPAEEWSRIFGWEGYEDIGVSVQETTDGGYIVASTTSDNNFNNDIRLIRTDSQGNMQWNRTFGGVYDDGVYSVLQTSDEGYLISGYTFVFDSEPSLAWIIKTDSQGEHQWNLTYGEEGENMALYSSETLDGVYNVAGSSSNSASSDAWLIRIDSQGNLLWNRTFSGDSNYKLLFVREAPDGGYVVAGQSQDESPDVCLIKTDSQGAQQWVKTFGSKIIDAVTSIQVTSDGGYIITGLTDSSDKELGDVWVVKTDDQGDQQWDMIFGWEECGDVGLSIQETSDGGYIVAGVSTFFDIAGSDALVIKIDSEGNRQWNKILGWNDSNEVAYSAQETSDGGYIVVGTTDSVDYYDQQIWLVNLGSNYSVPSDTFREDPAIKTYKRPDSVWIIPLIAQAVVGILMLGLFYYVIKKHLIR